MLYRKIDNKISKWFQSDINKALLITGARQVGKTYAIRKYLKTNNKSFVEFNLFENDLAKEAFETSKTAAELLLKISALSKTTLIKGETIIFIDEVQAVREIITKIKFLIEEGSYKYILSGSILGVELYNINSLPVGYMNILEMFPLDFEEFAIANGVSNNILKYLKDSFNSLTKLDEIIHKQMLKLFNLYIVVGGMPEAVKVYIESNNLQKVSEVHDLIDKMYRLDISKYDNKSSLLVKEIYDLIPSELNSPNKRFIMKNLSNKARFYQYETSFTWLLNSNIGLFVHNVDNPVFPLLASKKRTLFKLFLCDIGLLIHKLYNDNIIKILNNEVNINYGSLYESIVAQELTSKNTKLYYYNNKKKGEIDFLIEVNGEVIPIEVKSGKDYKRHLALNNLLNNSDYNINKAYTFTNGNIDVEGKIIYLPIYMIMYINQNQPLPIQEYNINIDALKWFLF